MGKTTRFRNRSSLEGRRQPREATPFPGHRPNVGQMEVPLVREQTGVPGVLEQFNDSTGLRKRSYEDYRYDREPNSGSDSETGSEFASAYSSDQEADASAWSDSSDEPDWFSLVDEEKASSQRSL